MIILNTAALQRVMEKERLTQSGLARKMGLSRSCINRHIRGKRKQPSAKVIGKLKETFPEYSIDFFLTQSVDNRGTKATREG